jgi:hypothetical protein
MSLNLPNISITPISTEFYSVWRFLAAPILFTEVHCISADPDPDVQAIGEAFNLKREHPAR